MPKVVHLDRISLLECIERNGVVRSLTRMATVTGLEDNIDYQVLMDALDQAGVPKYGATLDGENLRMLRLVDRHPRLLNDDKGTVEVTLTYDHVIDGPNQDIAVGPDPTGVDPPPEEGGELENTGNLYGKIRCSIHQTKRNEYFDWPDPVPGFVLVGPVEKKTILLRHTYPQGDKDFGGQPDEQSGEMEVFEPRIDQQISGWIITDNPYKILKSIVAKTNYKPWADGNPREWMCTEGTAEIGTSTQFVYDENNDPVLNDDGTQQVKKGKYLFTFEFQHNPLTWDVAVYYVNPRTGRPPKGLVEGEGKKRIKYYQQVDFNNFFKVNLEGFIPYTESA